MAFLFIKSGSASPRSSVIVAVIHLCRPRQGAKSHKAVS